MHTSHPRFLSTSSVFKGSNAIFFPSKPSSPNFLHTLLQPLLRAEGKMLTQQAHHPSGERAYGFHLLQGEGLLKALGGEDG